MAQSVKISGLDYLQEDLQKLAEELPDMKRQAHERLSEKMLREVQGNLSGKAPGGIGKVAGWQEAYVGTKGGYAAVRPKAKTFYKGDAVGYITNAVENGHAIRRPSGRWKNYRARIQTRYVLGLGFYKQTGGKLEKMAIEEANRLADDISRILQE